MTTTIQNTNDLLSFLISQANSGQKNWFSYQQQRIIAIDTAHKIAIAHANTMTPDQVVEYVITLNNAIYNKLIKA